MRRHDIFIIYGGGGGGYGPVIPQFSSWQVFLSKDRHSGGGRPSQCHRIEIPMV